VLLDDRGEHGLERAAGDASQLETHFLLAVTAGARRDRDHLHAGLGLSCGQRDQLVGRAGRWERRVPSEQLAAPVEDHHTLRIRRQDRLDAILRRDVRGELDPPIVGARFLAVAGGGHAPGDVGHDDITARREIEPLQPRHRRWRRRRWSTGSDEQQGQ
jgi:hypothetical protein